MTMPSDGKRRVAAVRRFNRFYTRQIGVLRKTYLDSPYSLAEARVLYEIGSSVAPTASAIGRTLDLDAGYLSRVLRNFEKRGLIQRRVSASDARQSHLALSARGRKSFTPLDRRSQRDTQAMLRGLAPAEQVQLIAAMNTIETLLGGEAAPPPVPARRYRLRAPVPGAAGSSNATASFTRRNMDGRARSRACARKSSPTSPTATIPSASAAGSPNWTARTSPPSCW